MDQFLTLEKAKLGPVFNKLYSICIYIYIYMPLTPFWAQKMPFIRAPNSLGGTVPATLFTLCFPYLGLIAHYLASLKLIEKPGGHIGGTVCGFLKCGCLMTF